VPGTVKWALVNKGDGRYSFGAITGTMLIFR